jgi:EAL domain-containing protein (putative c-di-GMP-specific phosphodiesterase class I)
MQGTQPIFNAKNRSKISFEIFGISRMPGHGISFQLTFMPITESQGLALIGLP